MPSRESVEVRLRKVKFVWERALKLQITPLFGALNRDSIHTTCGKLIHGAQKKKGSESTCYSRGCECETN